MNSAKEGERRILEPEVASNGGSISLPFYSFWREGREKAKKDSVLRKKRVLQRETGVVLGCAHAGLLKLGCPKTT